MGRTYRNVAVCLIALTIFIDQSSQVGNSQTKSKKQSNLATVPDPKDAEIRRLRSAEDWPNPYIVVYSGGFELVVGHRGEAIRKARVTEIEEVLLRLPLSRWPLGRVIAVTEIGLRNPGETLTKQREEMERMLSKHKVRVELWPSG
jgi:hypothetical protein